MAIIGFICLLLIGIFLTYGVFMGSIGLYGLQGRLTWEFSIFGAMFLMGCAVLWYAFSNMPFTINFNEK